MRSKLLERGFVEMAQPLMMVSSQQWDLDTINRFIECSGSILAWWKKQ